MATTAPAADRPHQAAKRYIYAWGDGTRRGQRRDAATCSAARAPASPR